MTTPLQAALKYAHAGYPVLPVWGLRGKACACPKGAQCPTPGKHPMIMRWQRQATTDVEQIKRWFAKHPAAHVGVMPPPGHTLLDVDPRNGGKETYKALINGHPLPVTPTQRSGGGGAHMVFRGEPRGPLGKGIDVKRHGNGYVVAWPSAHVSGGKYAWKPGREPWAVQPAPLPPALQGAQHQPAEGDAHAAPPPVEQVRAALRHIPADDYATWIKYGQALRHDYGERGRDLWLAWSKTSAKWQESDAAKWRTFDKNAGATPATAASILADARQRGYAPEFEAAAQPAAATGLVVQRSTDIATRELPPIKVFVPRLLTAGLTVVFGRAKLGKSWLMLQLARAVPSGGEFLGQRAARAKLLYLALEDNERRMKARMAKLDMTRVAFDVVFDAPRVDQGLATALAQQIEQGGYEVLIVDTLAAIAPASGHAKKGAWAADYDTMAALHRLTQRANVAIVVVSHTKKNSDHIDSQDAHMGTTGMLAGVDTTWVIQKRAGGAGGEGRMVLTVRGRDIAEEEYAVRFDRDTATWQMLGRAAQAVYSAQQQEILQSLRVTGTPMRHAELKRACGLGANFDAQLARLVRKGLVERDAQGRYTLATLEDIFGE